MSLLFSLDYQLITFTKYKSNLIWPNKSDIKTYLGEIILIRRFGPRLPQKACTEERLLEFPVRRMCVVFTGAARRILNIELALPVYLLGNSSI